MRADVCDGCDEVVPKRKPSKTLRIAIGRKNIGFDLCDSCFEKAVEPFKEAFKKEFELDEFALVPNKEKMLAFLSGIEQRPAR